MANDRDKAHELSNDGLLFENGSHISSGLIAPVHIANNGDWYLQTSPVILWRRVESAWVEILDCLLRDCSSKPTFHTTGPNTGEVNFIESFKGLVQTTINRRLRIDITYDAFMNPITEAWSFYDPADGTTVLKTFTVTHVWSGLDLVRSEGVLT